MFVIVRHGNTFAADETPRRIGARTDLPLTEAGREQARALGAHFAQKGWRFARALVSPLRRTRETAEFILEGQMAAPTPEVCEWLSEIDHGPDEDRPEAAVLARIGQDALDAWDERAEPPPGWSVDGTARNAAWCELFASPPLSQPTLIVTSNGAARFALLADPALTTEMPKLPSLKLQTGAYGVIRRGQDETLQISAWGQRP
jgi:broad specificity phosphatase PhoE